MLFCFYGRAFFLARRLKEKKEKQTPDFHNKPPYFRNNKKRRSL